MLHGFQATVSDLLAMDSSVVVGKLAARYPETTLQQRDAWIETARILLGAFERAHELNSSVGSWLVFLEYELPRLRRRIDALIVAGDVVFSIEFKIGANQVEAASVVQATDYALDLRDFHELAQQALHVVPALVPSAIADRPALRIDGDMRVPQCAVMRPSDLHELFMFAVNHWPESTAEPATLADWSEAPYRPVLRIVDSVESLYRCHTVDEIHQTTAGFEDVGRTHESVVLAVTRAREQGEHVVIFVTGVPGSGKTLVGLNCVHDSAIRFGDEGRAVFLSGNRPLVAVLSGALEFNAAGFTGAGAAHVLDATVQTLMGFLKQYLLASPTAEPAEKVVVFDEAQRAWDASYGANHTEFRREASEPFLFLDVMSRHSDWAVIVALVGGGQEINRGEGGIREWGMALEEMNRRIDRPSWRAVVSPHVMDPDNNVIGGSLMESTQYLTSVTMNSNLHLPVNIRSHRCEIANEWISSLLEGDISGARSWAKRIRPFPIYLSRSLDECRQWLKSRARGSRRSGLLASSGAKRLRAYGLGVGLHSSHLGLVKHWYLADREDVRSSYVLEVTASEYTSQGLEIDLGVLCWGGDLIWNGTDETWQPRRFHGSKWQRVLATERQRHALNSYRVLLSRCREALVIWVPPGIPRDRTNKAEDMDAVAEVLRGAGVEDLGHNT
jgi:Schlafen group 3, DNA/RNA helicase domain